MCIQENTLYIVAQKAGALANVSPKGVVYFTR